MSPDDVVRIAVALRKDLKLARKRGEHGNAPLNLMIDDLMDRCSGFKPKYELFGRTLRPYAVMLGVPVPPGDRALHEWIKDGLENLRKGESPALANLIVYHLVENRPDFLTDLIGMISEANIRKKIDNVLVKNNRGFENIDKPRVSEYSARSKFEPENNFQRKIGRGYNLRDLEIAAQRIQLERKNKTGVLDLSKLRIDSLPDTVGDLTWLRDLSCSVTSISRIDGLERLTELAVLHCSYGRLRELPSLHGCSKLVQITCGVSDIDSIAAVADCPSLERLYCGSTNVSDLTPLRACPALTILRCEDTQVSTLNGIEACGALRLLDCSDTVVNDLTPLDRLDALESLFLNGCRVEHHSPALWLKPSLSEVFFCRGSLRGVPSEVLSDSYDDNCLPRLREFFRNVETQDS